MNDFISYKIYAINSHIADGIQTVQPLWKAIWQHLKNDVSAPIF